MRLGLVIGVAALMACEGGPEPALEARHGAIVGGEREAGHAAVGALAHVVGQRYNGPFCTGTLIAPTWVLTAAHCIEGLRGSGQPGEAENVVFVVGPDARARDNRAPRDGTAYPVAALHQHPGFIFGSVIQVDDIALYELAEPVPDVAPYALWRQPMEALADGTELLYVGYGANDGVQRRGQGLRRSRSLPLTGVFPAHYLTGQPDGGTCYGDSGGPGLLLDEDPPAVVGVNSTVTGTTPAGAQCMELSSQTRVDAYQTWIDQVMGVGGACGEVPCACAEGCAEGVCDPLGCDTRGCRVLAECLSRCRSVPACILSCWDGGHREAHALYNAVISCGRAACPAGGNDCFNENCGAEIAACNGSYDPGAGGAATCGETIACVEGCNGDSRCSRLCYEAATVAHRAGYDAFGACAGERCQGQPSPAAERICLQTQCAEQAATCAAQPDCDLLAGACAEGTACVYARWGQPVCAPSGGRAEGARCPAGAVACSGVLCVEGDPCADGLACVDLGGGATCQPRCLADADCDAGGRCVRAQGAAYGGCQQCGDDDGDGFCRDLDCAPDDADRFPGNAETCGDGVDQDCDGEDLPCPPDAAMADAGAPADGGAPQDEGAPDAGVDALPIDAARPDRGDEGGPDLGPAPDQGADPDQAPAPDAAPRDRGIPTADGGVDPTQDQSVADAGCRATPGGGQAPWLLLLGLAFSARRRRRGDR